MDSNGKRPQKDKKSSAKDSLILRRGLLKSGVAVPLWLVLRVKHGYASQEEVDGYLANKFRPSSSRTSREGSRLSSCEDSCQTACEQSCQTSCEKSCQTACESSCQTSCEKSCQTACESSCQSACEASCKGSAEKGI